MQTGAGLRASTPGWRCTSPWGQKAQAGLHPLDRLPESHPRLEWPGGEREPTFGAACSPAQQWLRKVVGPLKYGKGRAVISPLKQQCVHGTWPVQADLQTGGHRGAGIPVSSSQQLRASSGGWGQRRHEPPQRSHVCGTAVLRTHLSPSLQTALPRPGVCRVGR